MKKILKVPLYIIIFVLVVILSGVYIYFFTTLPETEINNWLTGFAAKNYGLEISFVKVNRDIWNHLVLEGVEVASRTDTKAPIAYISRLEANYNIERLIRNDYHFSSIMLDSLYFRYPKGGLTFPERPESKDKSAAISLSIDKISVTTANVILPNEEKIDCDSIQLSLALDKGRLKLSLDKLAADWLARHMKIPAIYARVSSDSDGFVVDTLDVSTERSHIYLSGRVGKPLVKNLDLKFIFSPINLEDIYDLTRIKLTGLLEARGTFKGAIDDFEGEALVDGSFFEKPFDNVNLSYAFSDKVLKFNSIKGDVFKAQFDGSGRLDFTNKVESYAYDGSVNHLDLREIGPKLKTDFSGVIHLTGRGLGEKELNMAIDTKLHDVRIETYYFNEVSGPVQFDIKKINFLPGFKARYKNTYLDAQGSLEYQGNLDISGTAQFNDLTDFTDQIFIKQLGGRGQAQIHATGPTEDFNMQGSFNSDSCWTYGLFPGHIGIDVNLDTFISHRVGSVSGSWTGGTLYSIATDSGYFKTSVSGEKAFIDAAHVESPLGNLTMKGAYDGVAVPPVFHADTVYGIVDNHAFFSKKQIKLDVLTSGVKFDQFSMGYGTGTINISGIVTNELALNLNVQADSFQIEPFISEVYKDKAISGIWSGRAAVTGNFEKPVIKLDLAIDSLAVNRTPLGILRCLATYKDGYLYADSTWLVSEFGNYYLTGKLPMDLSFAQVQNRFPNEPIDLKLVANGNRLLLSEVFIPNIERYETSFFMGMNLTGTYAKPSITGYANLTNGRLKVLDLVNPLTNVNAYLRMDNQMVFIDSITASAAGSKQLQGIFKELLPGVNVKKEIPLLRATGTMTLLKLGEFAYNIDIMGRNFYFMADAYDIQGIADFNMRVTGERIPTVTGQATLKRLDVRDEFSRFVGREIDTSLVVEDSTLWNLNLHVIATNNLWIINNDVNAECKADVIVTREVGLLNIFGTLDIIRGTYNLFGQKFNVKTGTMAFNNVARINPYVDFDVTTRLKNPTAQGASPTPVEIEITGTLLEPQINMAGETSLSKDDFLKLLLAGSSFNPFAVGAQNQGSLSSNLLRSFSAVSSFIPDPLVASGLVQEFNIAPADTGAGTQISVARYISPSLYVSYSQTIAQGQSQSQAQSPSQQSSGTIVIEYFFNNNVSFQVARGTQGSPNEGISFDINLNFEY
jgi:hypothetical protein